VQRAARSGCSARSLSAGPDSSADRNGLAKNGDADALVIENDSTPRRGWSLSSRYRSFITSCATPTIAATVGLSSWKSTRLSRAGQRDARVVFVQPLRRRCILCRVDGTTRGLGGGRSRSLNGDVRDPALRQRRGCAALARSQAGLSSASHADDADDVRKPWVAATSECAGDAAHRLLVAGARGQELRAPEAPL